MLISFSVANYRSFCEEETLNMVANGKLASHPGHRVPIADTGKDVLRAAVIYGANAAGKSNLVRAMAVAQRFITKGLPSAEVEPFTFASDAPSRPMSFEFRFLLGERVFIYGFDVLRNQCASEWLAFLRGESEITIFERDAEGRTRIDEGAARHFSDDPVMFSTLAALNALPSRTDQLFLQRISSLPEDSQGHTLASVLRWLTTSLRVLPANHRMPEMLDRLKVNQGFRQFCSQFLDSVGTGICGLHVFEVEREAREWERSSYRPFFHGPDYSIRPKLDDATQVIESFLVADHKDGNLLFGQESDGTQQLLHLLPILAAAGDDDSSVFVIDELDRSLHPLLCWEFIRFFSESCPGAHRQLIVTTHEVQLLDQELLRRDEYWFVEKDESQQSRLVSLSEFNIRNDLQLRKGYLQGRFGAIPVIGRMDALTDLLKCEEPCHAAQEAPA